MPRNQLHEQLESKFNSQVEAIANLQSFSYRNVKVGSISKPRGGIRPAPVNNIRMFSRVHPMWPSASKKASQEYHGGT